MPDAPLLPCLEPNDGPQPAVLAAAPFAYIGTPLTLVEFVAYVKVYNFGSIPPDQLVIHNTANPDASWASLGTSDSTWWDRDEAGLSPTAIRNKRQKQLDAIKAYYVGLEWSAGPHLFVDERWIWLFTPMAEIGIHAKEGNSYRDTTGHLHYTIGIETVGWFGRNGWPPAMQALLSGAVRALRDRLRTFEIAYKRAPAHQPALHQGSIAFHFDYNKQSCPGAVITPAYAIPILAGASEPPAPADPFAAWGAIDRPAGAAQLFAIPQTWLKNKATLGECLRGERYDIPGRVSRALFQGGEVRYFRASADAAGIVDVLKYPAMLLTAGKLFSEDV